MSSRYFKLSTPPRQGSNVPPGSIAKKGGGGFGGMDVEAVNLLVHKPL